MKPLSSLMTWMMTFPSNMPKYPLYKYQWYDHFSNSSWVTKDKVKSEAYLVESVGFLVDEDDTYYYFTDGVVTSTEQFRGTMAILKKALKGKTKLASTS